ncbi:head-tail connector protein [Tritonibacter scottomollicae]|uniref:head-tail connector protein n=1 Tax=Tritonibacter scottomollicae TaxID=483013 RepID=UPI003AA809B3
MPPDLSGEPLGELKQWLAISTAGEDALLLRLLGTAWQVCLQFTGITATQWADLDEALRHGIIRFAAHQYRERDERSAGHLPTSIAALWRPYRMVRL